ncbi:ATP-binding protein [Tateyamaria sp. Alg231-49]|uniref:sensor histidine kinase n=1 Tax=Tateyamaria sp. Alg231-49 TaxID=1922219 RepID=UPI000D5571F8|nr:ATP-binding protein [Tateyamaria sp. Alg231-49]
MPQSTENFLPRRMRRGVLGVLILTVALATLLVFMVSQRYFERVEAQTAANRSVLYLRSVNEMFRQHQHLPFVIASDPRNSTALGKPEEEPFTSARLKEITQQAKLEAIYLMDAKGLVVASSNAGEPQSFLGQNYGFRPYFQNALKGQRSDYFAIGATSGRPGYFVAEPIMVNGDAPQGVMAIKIDVSGLQRFWESNSETVVAVDENNIVVLASDPSWLYRPIGILDTDVRQRIMNSRQFGVETLAPLPWEAKPAGRALVDGRAYLANAVQSDWREWTVYYLHPQSLILRQTLIATALFSSAIAMLVGFSTYLRSRRIALAYQVSERQRNALVTTNHQLEVAQTELARSSKMAALGNIAASVTHELGQPISAFKNHLAAAEIGNEITSPATAANLNKLVNRMESITQQFKFFVRGRQEDKKAVRLSLIINETTALLSDDLSRQKITLECADIDPAIYLYGNQVQLEQVFTNLMKNAIQAVADTLNPVIHVTLSETGDQVEIRIFDNGPGLEGANLSDLQEPFFSTKPSGVGMGLGLAIATQIIHDHEGTLRLGSVDQGAEFIVTLPRMHDEESI